MNRTPEKIAAMVDAWLRAEELHCPYCDHEIPLDDFPPELISYWGQEGRQEIECPSCQREFWVTEYVHRTFETEKKEGEA